MDYTLRKYTKQMLNCVLQTIGAIGEHDAGSLTEE